MGLHRFFSTIIDIVDRTKNYHPEMPGSRVLGCTCRGGHMSHFGGEQKYQVIKLVK